MLLTIFHHIGYGYQIERDGKHIIIEVQHVDPNTLTLLTFNKEGILINSEQIEYEDIEEEEEIFG